MLDTLNLKLSLDKPTYRLRVEQLMEQLRFLQENCWHKKLPFVVVLEGWAASGKGAIVKKMIRYMDPRGFVVYPILSPSPEEQRYPFLWRFHKTMPAKGNISVYYHSWYTHLLEDRLFQRIPETKIPEITQHINAFERQSVEDGTAIAKFWIHISQKELKTRLKDYADDPLQSWRIRPEDWHQHHHYSHYCTYAEEMITLTSTGTAPWILVEGTCQRWARVKVLQSVAATLTEVLDREHVRLPPPILPPQKKLEPFEPDLLVQADLSLNLTEKDYKRRLAKEQIELRRLQLDIFQNQIPVLILFEGWDASGKGGAIKRLTDILDPRSYVVHAFSAPSTMEKDHHYLWRFWQRLPTAGTIGIFDRSWYGRVLVERVENLATDTEWRRAYREINEFESQLTGAGYILIKYWLHISPEEQLQRFKEREHDTLKQYKLTNEDWRNREKWDFYYTAANQMIQRTSTPTAPWNVIPANDKYYARVKIVQTVVESIRTGLKRPYAHSGH